MTGIIYFVVFIVVCAIVSAIVFVMLSIVAERRAEGRYSGDPDAFFEKERQDTDKYDIPALKALKPKTAREIADSLKRTADKVEEAD